MSALMSPGPTEVTNTRFIVSGNAPVYYIGEIPGIVKIAGSQLPGDLTPLVGATLVNCYDAQFRPIADQYVAPPSP